MSILTFNHPKLSYSIIFVVSIFFVSCNQKDKKEIIPVPISDTIVSVNDKSKVKNQQIDDTIYLNFIDKKGLFTVEGLIDSIHPRIYVKFENDKIGKLKAKIVTKTEKGNIRFNQIVFPNQTADGPFGTDLNLELKQTGKHMLVIGHSLMADNPYVGKFKVELQITSE